MTIMIVFVLLVMSALEGLVINVKGAFLKGYFNKWEELFMRVPEGMEHHYPPNVVLLLLRTIYCLKQAAYAFWKELLQAMRLMDFDKSTMYPCLYHRWANKRLTMIISWVDDCLIVGKSDDAKMATKEVAKRFDCDDIGIIKEKCPHI